MNFIGAIPHTFESVKINHQKKFNFSLTLSNPNGKTFPHTELIKPMNTKSLLLAAVIAALGTASASAQVTSQNIVGYIRLSLGKGFNLVSNQLKNGNNNINTVLAEAPEGTIAYKWTGASFTSVEKVGTEFEGAAAFSLNPGEGVFVNVPAATTVTLIGEVSLQNSVPLKKGFNLVGCPLPLAGRVSDPATVGMTAVDDDKIYQWSGSSFASTEFIAGAWETADGNKAGPQIKVGEGFFYSTTSARNYVRNFAL